MQVVERHPLLIFLLKAGAVWSNRLLRSVIYSSLCKYTDSLPLFAMLTSVDQFYMIRPTKLLGHKGEKEVSAEVETGINSGMAGGSGDGTNSGIQEETLGEEDRE